MTQPLRVLRDDELEPFDLGWLSNARMRDQSHNPFPPGSPDWEEWIDGWRAYRDYRPGQ